MAGNAEFIGKVAQQTGLSVHAIRFYEAGGLLPEAPRNESGYRLYSPASVMQLKFIRKAQALGFSLDEIRELLILKDNNTDGCSHVKSLVREKLRSVRMKQRELESMETDLKRVLADCQRQSKRRHPRKGKPCPVLVKLGREDQERKRVSKERGSI